MRASRVRLFTVAVVAVLLAGLLGPAAVAASDTDRGVFEPTAGPAERATGRHALRERFVTVDLSRLSPEARASGTVVFNLFDDTVVKATMESIEVRGPGDYTWIGEVGRLGYVVITVKSGVAAGQIIDEAGRAFTVSYVGDGVHVVTEPDLTSYPPRIEPRGVEVPQGPVSVARAADEPIVLTLLTVYTKAAMQLRGGKDAIEVLLVNAIAEFNLALQKSKIDVVVELVDTRQISYTESGDFETDLSRVTDPGDGFVDGVHGWRDDLDADLVSLIIDDPAACGFAWTPIMGDMGPSWEAWAFSAVYADCIDFEATIAHEVAHNLGANHERGVELGDTLYPYAYGWVDYVNGFRTIMAYGDLCQPQSPGAPNSTGCPMILRFSSSKKSYQGYPTGDEDNDNARTINQTAPVVAEFRTKETCNGLEVTIGPDAAVDGVIKGTKNDDVILGSDGDDIIKGKRGDDTICSLGGKDKVFGNAGNDTIFGGNQRDILKGGGGTDALFGENGNDKLIGNRGKDTGDGGPGTDRCVSIETATSCER